MVTNKKPVPAPVMRPGGGTGDRRSSAAHNGNPFWPNWTFCLALLLAGCEPEGPKALLEGEKLLQQERYNEAIRALHLAAESMPREARAWNFLGLAYQGSGLDTEAAQAYKKALDVDHRLSAAHFNLGCLWLEQNQPQLAVSELTAFTLLQPNSVSGWLRLGAAHLRLGKFDTAETAYRTALNVVPRHPEALNGLGYIQVNRRRYVDAVQYFQAALAESPGYAPALLNQASVTHRYLNQRSTALQKYRQYLALQPRPENWDAVNVVAQSLADEISGAGRSPLLAVTTNLVTRSNLPATPVANSSRFLAASNTTSSTVPQRPGVLTPNTRDPKPSPPLPIVSTPTTAAEKPSPVAAPPQPTPPAVQVPAVLRPAPVTRKEEEPPPIVVADVAQSITIPPAQEITRPKPDPQPNSQSAPRRDPIVSTTLPRYAAVSPSASQDRPGFFQRLNPFRKNNRTDSVASQPTANPSTSPAPAPEPMVANRELASRQTAPPPPEVVVAGNFNRYSYRQLTRPQSGDRVRGAELVNRGIIAHQERRSEEELAFYRSATLTDPASYDAFFNLGLASAEQGDWKTALNSYEQALAIDPDSVSSRYNFAQALRQGGYPVDAARELESILQARPQEPRSLLSLGNLYAQTFKQPRTARQYYLRLLEADPNHPKAAEVRWWLSANP